LPVLWFLVSCTSPPKPPTVDPSLKRPVNTAGAVELEVCRGELHNSRILASETTRLAESATATVHRLASMQPASTVRPTTPAEQGNAIYTVHFAFGSSEVKVPDADAPALTRQARNAALVMMRGRTDGTIETVAESRIARERVAAVRTYLVQAGVDPSRIRATYQPVGDYASDNGTATGRALNRRVEIEIYSVVPQPLAVGQVARTSDAETSAQ